MEIPSTSGRLHSEFVRLLSLQAHRETDRFFAASGVQSAQSTSGGFFHFHRAAFSSGSKIKVGLALAKAVALRIVLNLDGTPITSKSHTHPSHSETDERICDSTYPISSSSYYSEDIHTKITLGITQRSHDPRII